MLFNFFTKEPYIFIYNYLQKLPFMVCFFMNSLLNGNPTDELFKRRKERLLKENTSPKQSALSDSHME